MSKVAKKPKPMTKTEFIAKLSDQTELTRKDVAAVVDALCDLIKHSVGPKGEGAFALPGVLKVEKKRRAAKPAQKNVKNPLTGKTYDRPAKPAHDVVRIKVLTGLKEAAK